MSTAGASHEGGLSVRDQIERYRSAFIAVLTLVVIAAVVGGYILAHENLKLPGWVPVLGHEYFKLEGEFQTAQAVTPGQGQAVTIAGAKIGEIATVDLNHGVALVTMNVNPKYAKYIYRDATMLLRPKTGLQDITVEVSPGNASTGKLHSGEVLPVSQTAANIDFDEFLAGLDAETRSYLQELLAGLGIGLKGNSRLLAADLKRFDPLAKYTEEIAQQVEIRHANVARSKRSATRTSRSPSSSTPPTRCSPRSKRRKRPSARRSSCCPGRCTRRASAWPIWRSPRTC
jgi:phospholipid/cholesterol/gamma-HCH transport system substrate-binding protein